MATTKITKNTFVSTVQLSSPPMRTKIFNTIKDAGIQEYNQYLNYGDLRSILLTPTNRGKNANMFEFNQLEDFHNVKILSRIISATLTLIPTSGNGYGHLIKTYGYNNSNWFELGITWYHAHVNGDANIGDLLSEDVLLPYQKLLEIDVTDYFVDQMKNGKDRIDFYLTSDDEDLTTPVAINARESKYYVPKLVVKYYDQPMASSTRILDANEFDAAVLIPDPDTPRNTDDDYFLNDNTFKVDSTMKRIDIEDNKLRVPAFSAMTLEFFDKDKNQLHLITPDNDIDLDTIQKYREEKEFSGSESTGDINGNRFFTDLRYPDIMSPDNTFEIPVFSVANVKYLAKGSIKYNIKPTDELSIDNLPKYYEDTEVTSESDLDLNGNQFYINALIREDSPENKFFIVKGEVTKYPGEDAKPVADLINKFEVSSGVFEYTVRHFNNDILYKGMDFGVLGKFAYIKRDEKKRPIGFDKITDNKVKGIDSDGDVGATNNPNKFTVMNTIYGKYYPGYKEYPKNPNDMPEISGNTFTVWEGSAFKFNFFDSTDAKLKDANNKEISDVTEIDDIKKYSADVNTKVILSTGDIPAMNKPEREATKDGSLGALTGNGSFFVRAMKRNIIDENKMFIYKGEKYFNFPEGKDNNFFNIHAMKYADIDDNKIKIYNDHWRKFYIGIKDNITKNPEPLFREGIDETIGTEDNTMFIHALKQNYMDCSFIVERHAPDFDTINKKIIYRETNTEVFPPNYETSENKFYYVKGSFERYIGDSSTSRNVLNTFKYAKVAPYVETLKEYSFRVEEYYDIDKNEFFIVKGDVIKYPGEEAVPKPDTINTVKIAVPANFVDVAKAKIDNEYVENQFLVPHKLTRTMPSNVSEVNKFFVVKGDVIKYPGEEAVPKPDTINTFVIPHKTDPKDPELNLGINQMFIHALSITDSDKTSEFKIAVPTNYFVDGINQFDAANKIAFWYFNPSDNRVHSFIVPHPVNVDPIDDNKFNVNIRVDISDNKFRVPFKEKTRSYAFIMQ